MEDFPAFKPLSVPTIPDEIIFTEILPKVPLKSLMRFKCVSKPWKSKLSSPKYAKFLLKSSKSDPQNHGVLLQSSSSLYAVPNYAVYDGDDTFDFEPLKLKLDHHGLKDGVLDVIDSCNGLICLFPKQSTDLCVWNPFTRECRRISGFSKKYVMFEPSLWAFGYVPSLDDYKIVNSCYTVDVYAGKKRATLTRVFSLRNGVLKEYETKGPLGRSSTKTTSMYGVVLANAKCHWLLVQHTDFFSVASVFILVFDLVTESFDCMTLPRDLFGDDKRDFREHAVVGVIEGYLCLASQGCGQCLEVCVMECYGEEESWTKIFKVGGVMTPAIGGIKFCGLSGFRTSGKLLLHLNHEVWVFHWSDSNPKCVRVGGVHTRNTSEFVQSLISPFMMDEDAADQ